VITRVTTLRQRREQARTLALSTDVTLRLRPMANFPAHRAIRSISGVVYFIVSTATPSSPASCDVGEQPHPCHSSPHTGHHTSYAPTTSIPTLYTPDRKTAPTRQQTASRETRICFLSRVMFSTWRSPK